MVSLHSVSHKKCFAFNVTSTNASCPAHHRMHNHAVQDDLFIKMLLSAAPSSPQNVTVLVLNPTTVEVQWLPPNEFNDEKVWYEVHWCTEGMVAGVRQKMFPATDKHMLQKSNCNIYSHILRL